MPLSCLIPAIVAPVALGLSTLVAAPSELPTGRLSVITGPRAGTGGLADELGLGCVIGVEAGYQPMGPDQRLGWGASWSTLLSWYGDGSARVADQLAMVEMDLGLRVRAALGARRRLTLHGGGGGALLRLNEPVVRDGSRAEVGFWAAGGIEFSLRGTIVGVSLRYAPIVNGSGTIGLQLAIGRGS